MTTEVASTGAQRAQAREVHSPDTPASGIAPSVAQGASRIRRLQAPAGTLTVSVVVPTYHRTAFVERCLAALAAQKYPPRAYEIVVADDACCDETRAVVARWAERCRARGPAVRYVAVHDAHGPAAARNAGWHAARGDVVAFTDDDCLPEPSWLRAGTAVLLDGAMGATGRLVVPVSERPTDYELNAAQLSSAQFATANCFYRREALTAVGGFDERFQAAWREDSDLYCRMLASGAELLAAPDAVVAHPIRPAAWGVSLRQQRKSMYNALLYKKSPRFYRERVQAGPPWRYYVTLGALGLLGLGLTRRRPRWTFLGAALWTWLTGRFCMRRLSRTSHAPGHVAEMIVTSALIPPLAVYWRLRGALRFRVLFL